MTRLLTTAIAALALAAPAAAAQGDLLFSDLRAWGGWTTGGGSSISLGLLAGDLTYDASVGCAGGLVVGTRLHAERVPAVAENNGGAFVADLVGLQLVGGLGLDWNARNSLELLGGYGAGFGDAKAQISKGGKDGRWHQWIIELNWFHTFKGGLQLGLSAAYENTGLDYTPPGMMRGTARVRTAQARVILGTRL
jgi:hypothetical protein